MTDLFQKSGLPENESRLKQAFIAAHQASLDYCARKAPDSMEEHTKILEQFLLDQALAPRLLLSINDGVPKEERMDAAIAPFIATYMTYSEQGLSGAVRMFGIKSTLYATYCGLSITWLKKDKTNLFAKTLGERTREAMVSYIISGFEQFKSPEYLQNRPDAAEKIEVYRKHMLHALDILRSDALPSPLSEGAARVRREFLDIKAPGL